MHDSQCVDIGLINYFLIDILGIIIFDSLDVTIFKMSVNGKTFVRRLQSVKIHWGALYVTAAKLGIQYHDYQMI